jgi:formate hydrogenlyase subunit 5
MELRHDITGAFNRKTAAGREVYISVTHDEFIHIMPELAGSGAVLIGLFCMENFAGHSGFTLFYALERRGSLNVVILVRHLTGPSAESVADIFPSASWFEREAGDGFGIKFPGAFDRRRLFLHEMYPEDFHPLRKEFANRPVETLKNITADREYKFKELTGEGVYQIPVGPVHAGIIEPGHFRFSVIGETVFNLEIRMFWKHRGIEKLAEGKSPDAGVTVAETISGDESAANAVAYSRAVEKIAGHPAPDRAWYLRTILLEMERVYSHLGDLAGMNVDVAFARGASRFFILREEILRFNRLLTGSRFLKGIVCPGGLKKDIDQGTLADLAHYLNGFIERFKSVLYLVYSTTSVVDRFEGTGMIAPELVNLLNITGPAARAAGIKIDVRRDFPYGIYPALEFEKRTAEKSDVKGRFNVKAQEVFDSVAMIHHLVEHMPQGEVYKQLPAADGYAMSLIEAPRGQNLHWLCIKDGKIDRYKIRSASFCNWQAIEHAVPGNIVPDFPLINKSLNLSYAGTDL